MIQRSYAGVSDLRLMQYAVSRNYEHILIRIGDIAWRARYHTHSELTLEIRLWEAGGQVVAYTWLRTRGGFDIFIAREHQGELRLLGEMLDVVEGAIRVRLKAGDELRQIYTFFRADDQVMANALFARGFARSDEPAGMVLQHELNDIPAAEVPSGYRLDWVEDEHDVAGRVEAHRAAFAPSDLTLPMYQRVRRTWPYRPELDRVMKAEDGRIVAFCTAWIDEENRAALLEPVGTHPDHQNLGLGRAVTADALIAVRAAGATVAQIGTSGAAALRTYTSVGFREWALETTVRKSVGTG